MSGKSSFSQGQLGEPNREFRSVFIPLGYVVLLVLACFLVYGKTGGFGFLGSEDRSHVSEFHSVATAGLTGGWKVMATTLRFGQWIPVALVSHKIDCLIFGLDGGWHHLVNIMIHTACCCVFMFLLKKLGASWLAGFLAALLLAVHPQHVQLVAWIAERKDLLSYLFALLSLLAYVHWVQGARRSARYFWLALGLFAIGLASRFIIMGLPLILLALDSWPLGRKESLASRLNEKIPFFILGILFLGLTMFLQFPQTARFGVDEVRLFERLCAISWNVFLYLWHTVSCASLTFYNGFPFALSTAVGVLAFFLCILISAGAWRIRKRWPILGVSWMWYLAALLPVCGICILGPNFHSDHYSYLPHMGIFLLVAFLIDRLPQIGKWGAVAAVLAASFYLGAISTKQTDSYTGMDAVAQREARIAWDRPYNVYLAAELLSKEGKEEEARRCWARVTELEPSRNLSASHHALARIHFREQNYDAALESLTGAIDSTDTPSEDLIKAHEVVAAYLVDSDSRSLIDFLSEGG